VASRQHFVRIAYQILRNMEDAEDAVQDAFLSACRHFREFEGRSALRTWLTRIVINASLLMLRKRKNVALRFLRETDAASSALVEAIPDRQPNPESAYSQAESFELLDTLLNRMNPLLRDAVRMAYYDELSTPEASSALGVSISTYKARLFRGRRVLQERARRRI
jgi:RNA polymerase sigma-70 factor, ECF subfamily